MVNRSASRVKGAKQRLHLNQMINGRRRWISRLLMLGLFGGLLVFVPAMTMAPTAPEWAPEPLKLYAYDMRLLVGRPLTALSILKNAVAGETAVALATAGQPTTFESNGLTLAATFYTTESETNKPGILLLHGSTPHGRRLGMYRVLGQQLAQAGFVVLTIDQRGYNWSDNPPDVSDPASFDFVTDVSNALTFLSRQPGVDPDSLYLIGHSFGGDVAMTAVQQDQRIDKLIVIGPGRRFLERGGTPSAPEFDYFKRRDMRYMLLWQPIPDEVYLTFRSSLPIENHLDYFAQPTHVPTLFIDGELESEADRRFLQEVVTGMQGETAYETLVDADHYANIGNIGPLLIYDQGATEALVEMILQFIQAPSLNK